MSLIKFLLYRKKVVSLLASRKYGEKKVDPEELDKSLLAARKVFNIYWNRWNKKVRTK